MGATGSHEIIDVSGKSLESLQIPAGKLPQDVVRFYARRNRLREVPAELAQLERLQEISLRDNQFQVFPAVLLRMKHLVKLSLAFNRLTTLPKEIGQLTELQLLSLAGNQLDRLPDSIGHLVHLRSLDLQRNQLVLLPDSLCALTHLQELLLQRNQLRSLSHEISRCKRLRVLHGGNNQLTFLPPSLTQLVELEELHLSCNRIAVLPPGLFSKLTALRVFDAHTNLLKQMPRDIGKAQRLRRLNFAINQLTTLPVEISQLRQLEWLNINGNMVEELPTAIAGLEGLKKFGLVQNRLRYLPNEIAAMKSLCKLDVRRNQLVAFPPTIRFMHQLTGLVYSGNPLCTTFGKQSSPQGHQGPNSLLELTARSIWSTHLRNHLLASSQTNIHEATAHWDGSQGSLNGSVSNSSYDLDADRSIGEEFRASSSSNTNTTISSGMNQNLQNLDITEHLKRMLAQPKVCHLCLTPYCSESIAYVDESAIRGMEPHHRIPIRYLVCSEKCVQRLEGKITFDPRSISTAGLLAMSTRQKSKLKDILSVEAPSSNIHGGGISSNGGNSSKIVLKSSRIASAPFEASSSSPFSQAFSLGAGTGVGSSHVASTSVSSSPLLTPRLVNRNALTGTGYAWYAFVVGEPPERPQQLQRHDEESVEASSARWIVDRLRDTFLTRGEPEAAAGAAAAAMDGAQGPRDLEQF